jgi:hypothetical protein
VHSQGKKLLFLRPTVADIYVPECGNIYNHRCEKLEFYINKHTTVNKETINIFIYSVKYTNTDEVFN